MTRPRPTAERIAEIRKHGSVFDRFDGDAERDLLAEIDALAARVAEVEAERDAAEQRARDVNRTLAGTERDLADSIKDVVQAQRERDEARTQLAASEAARVRDTDMLMAGG